MSVDRLEWSRSEQEAFKQKEASNVPVVLAGGVVQWPAILRWDPKRGGVNHLKNLAGSATVQAITSNHDSGSAFYGHIRGHGRVSLSFASFLDLTMSLSANSLGSVSAEVFPKVNGSENLGSDFPVEFPQDSKVGDPFVQSANILTSPFPKDHQENFPEGSEVDNSFVQGTGKHSEVKNSLVLLSGKYSEVGDTLIQLTDKHASGGEQLIVKQASRGQEVEGSFIKLPGKQASRGHKVEDSSTQLTGKHSEVEDFLIPSAGNCKQASGGQKVDDSFIQLTGKQASSGHEMNDSLFQFTGKQGCRGQEKDNSLIQLTGKQGSRGQGKDGSLILWTGKQVPSEGQDGDDSSSKLTGKLVPSKGQEVEDSSIPLTGKQVPSKGQEVDNPSIQMTAAGGEQSSAKRENPQLYLAQVPIYSKDSGAELGLSSLMADIALPSVLSSSSRVTDINLWMSMSDSKTSTHYDPYHNLLCVVSGQKKVTLWPPSAAPMLYPLPVFGEASNHSAVDFVHPNFDTHPLFKKAGKLAKVATLLPGDVLYIPEGWYHQVDNLGITIAVNFWWPSEVSLALGTEMDAYFFRRLVVSLVDNEKKRMLEEEIKDLGEGSGEEESFTVTEGKMAKQEDGIPAAEQSSCALDMISSKFPGVQQSVSITEGKLAEMEIENLSQGSGGEQPIPLTDKNMSEVIQAPEQRSSVLEMISSRIPVVQSVDQSPKLKSVEALQKQITEKKRNKRKKKKKKKLAVKSPELETEEAFQKVVAEGTANRLNDSQQTVTVEDLTAFEACNLRSLMASVTENSPNSPEAQGIGLGDSVTRVLSALEAVSLQRIFMAMVNQFPRTLQMLIMTRLSPSAAEILTRKFEELDSSSELSLPSFYEQFFSVFDDPEEVMEALLNGKEAFAAQALSNVMTRFLGLSCNTPK